MLIITIKKNFKQDIYYIVIIKIVSIFEKNHLKTYCNTKKVKKQDRLIIDYYM